VAAVLRLAADDRSARADAAEANVDKAACVAVVAGLAVFGDRLATQARQRVTLASLVAGALRLTGDWRAALALACLAGIVLGTRVAVFTGRAVVLGRVAALTRNTRLIHAELALRAWFVGKA
jgi:hypothetical protein